MGATGAHAERCFLIVMADGDVVEFRFNVQPEALFVPGLVCR